MEESVLESERLVPSLNLNTREKVEEDSKGAEPKEGEEANEEKEDGDKGSGGLMNNLISHLVSPLSAKAREDGGKREVQDEEGERKKGGGGLLFNNLISNFLNQSEGEEEGKYKNVEEEEGLGDEGKQAKIEEEGCRGIINTIVSNLPVSLPDGAVPAPDEASILIHSIIHD